MSLIPLYDSIPKCPENLHDFIGYDISSNTLINGTPYDDSFRAFYGFFFDQQTNKLLGQLCYPKDMVNVKDLITKYFVIFILDVPKDENVRLPLLIQFKLSLNLWIPRITNNSLNLLEFSNNFVRNLYLINEDYFNYQDILSHRSPFFNIYGNFFLSNEQVLKAKNFDLNNRNLIISSNQSSVKITSEYTLARIFVEMSDNYPKVTIITYLSEPYNEDQIDYSITKVYNIALPITSLNIDLNRIYNFSESIRKFYTKTGVLNLISVDSD